MNRVNLPSLSRCATSSMNINSLWHYDVMMESIESLDKIIRTGYEIDESGEKIIHLLSNIASHLVSFLSSQSMKILRIN